MVRVIPDDTSRLDRDVWARHANPLSGWTRVPTLPLLTACLYRRQWRGLLLTLAFVAVNPFLFPPPEDDSTWMTRAVYSERRWTAQADTYSRYPGLLIVAALYGAVKQRPAETALATALSMALKLWFVAEMVHLYDERVADSDHSG